MQTYGNEPYWIVYKDEEIVYALEFFSNKRMFTPPKYTRDYIKEIVEDYYLKNHIMVLS